MRLIFMGTPDFAVGTLEALIEAGHEVALVVTQPDKPRGRSKKLQYPPVKEAALAHNIEVFQPKRVREAESIEYLKKIPAGLYRRCGIWTDPAKRDFRNAKILLCERSCIPASEVSWSSTDPVGGHQWRKSQRRDHDAYG